MADPIQYDSQRLTQLCRAWHVRRLSLFGSALHGQLRPDSDIDLLAEFEPGHVPGLEFFALQDELSQLFGRTVDLQTAGFLSRHFRDDVLAEARPLYAA